MLTINSQFTVVISRLRLYEFERRFNWQKMSRIRERIEQVADEFETVTAPWFTSQDPERVVSITLVGKLLEETYRQLSELIDQSSRVALSDPSVKTDPRVIAIHREIDESPPYTGSIDFPSLVAVHLFGESETPREIDDHQPVYIVAEVLHRFFGDGLFVS
jgi:hypothetical protein